MGHDISAGLISASSGAVFTPIIMAKLEFDTPVYVHTGAGTISHDSNDYLGVGTLGGVSSIEEPGAPEYTEVSLTLSGIDSSLISILLGTSYQGKTATLYYTSREPDGSINTPYAIFVGLIDTADISSGETASIDLKIVNRLAFWDRPNIRRYNNAEQQTRFPGDKGLEFVDELATTQIIWGGKDENA